MLTIDKVNAARAEQERHADSGTRTVVAFLAAFLALSIAAIPVYWAVAAWGWSLRDTARVLSFLFFGMMTVGCLAMLRSLYRTMILDVRDPRLRCPHCGRSFCDDVRLVVATRNCPRCGHRILADPLDTDAQPAPSPPPLGLEGGASALMTIEKFNEERDNLSRRSMKALMWACLIGLIGGIACYAAASPFRPRIDAFFDGQPKDSVAIVSLFGVVVTLFAALFSFDRSESWKPRCPHCGGSIGRQARLVIATRNCPHCGRRALAEPIGKHGAPAIGPPPDLGA